jgi:hypothetical protein
MATFDDMIRSLPNDLIDTITSKVLMPAKIRARTMPVPELHTALPKPTGSEWYSWQFIEFDYKDTPYIIYIGDVGPNQGITLNRVKPTREHILLFKHTEIGLPSNLPSNTLTANYDTEILPLTQALITVLRRFFPSVTPESIKVIYGPEKREMSLRDFMSMIKSGGGAVNHAKVKFEGSVYKVHTCKTGQGKYITVRKERIFLKDIRRRYRYVLEMPYTV